MNLQDISLRIENPTLLVDSDIPILQDLAIKYPYSQLLSILYLKTLSKNQSLNLEEEVSKHAYKITDRLRLFELLNEPEELEVVREIVETSGERRETRDVLITIERSEKLEEVESLETEEEVAVKKLEVESGILDLDVISHAISGVFEQEFEPKIVKSEEIRVTEKGDLEIESSKLAFESIKGSKQRFTTWMKAGDLTKTETAENKFERLIDIFIQEDPKISQPKKEFYSPIKQGKESLDSDNIQYTETLANILGIQGNYPKAILAYEQLCLTIPEKKTFFVQKIKELKEKLNS